MKSTTLFFPILGSLLCGRPPRSIADSLRAHAQSPHALSQLQEAFDDFIPASRLSATASGVNSRQRVFSLSVSFWAFLAQTLCVGSSCRAAVRKVQAWWASQGTEEDISEDTSAYCQARARLPDSTLEAIHDDLAARLQRNVPSDQLWHGRPVKIVDGTNLSMPDTAANQTAYPQQRSQKPGCGFPMIKAVGLFCLVSGALLKIARGTLHVHESKLFRRLWQFLHPGDVILTDRGFCGWPTLAGLHKRGVDCVMRLHQGRFSDFRRGKRLGPRDRLQRWNKPQRTKAWTAQEWAELPDYLDVRLVRIEVPIKGFRTRQVLLVTTLLDPVEVPVESLAELYFLRWNIELHFREIKILLGMDVLRCQTPAMIHKEVWMHCIAYNLVRVVMQQASQTHAVPLPRISFKGSLDTMREWADVIHAARGKPRKQEALHAAMLQVIACDPLPERPGRSEPRARKRRPKNYQLLTRPRHQMKVCPHRCNRH